MVSPCSRASSRSTIMSQTGSSIFGPGPPFDSCTALSRRAEMRVDLLQNALLRHVADEALRLATVLEEDHRRDRADAKAPRGERIRVHVELGDPHLVVLACDLFEHRRDHAARTAPRRPEVHQDRAVGLEALLLKVLVANHRCLCKLCIAPYVSHSPHSGQICLYHLNASCCPACSTAGSRPRTGSSPSRLASGSARKRRSGAHFTNRQRSEERRVGKEC